MSMDMSSWLRKQLEDSVGSRLREMVATFAEELMGAEADSACGESHQEHLQMVP